MSTIYHTAW